MDSVRMKKKKHTIAIPPVGAFLVGAFVLSWPFLIFGSGWFDPGRDPLKRYLFMCMGMLMVALSAFLTRVLVERRGFGAVGWNLGHGRWYLAVLLFCSLLWLGPPLAALALGKMDWNRDLAREELLVIVLSLGGFSLLAGFGEEFGWRGYLLPRLLSERSIVRGVLVLVGLVWGIWHCALAVGPLLRAVLEGTANWLSLVGPTLTQFAQMIGASLALSFIFGAVWLRSRSIFLSSFLHGYWIGIRDAASHLVRYPPAFRLITLIAVLAAWFIANRWLKGYERNADH
jgi:membrane protease YdiL (CAAX protease family)